MNLLLNFLPFLSIYFFTAVSLYVLKKLNKVTLKSLKNFIVIDSIIVFIIMIIEIFILLSEPATIYVINLTIYHKLLVVLGFVQFCIMFYLLIKYAIKKSLK